MRVIRRYTWELLLRSVNALVLPTGATCWLCPFSITGMQPLHSKRAPQTDTALRIERKDAAALKHLQAHIVHQQ